MSEADIRAERLKKLQILKDSGMDAYPARTERNTAVTELLEGFDKFEKDATEVTIAGRVMSRRGQGGISLFCDIDTLPMA